MNADTNDASRNNCRSGVRAVGSKKRVGLAIVAFVPAIFWTGLLDALDPCFSLYFTSIFLGLVGLAIAVFLT